MDALRQRVDEEVQGAAQRQAQAEARAGALEAEVAGLRAEVAGAVAGREEAEGRVARAEEQAEQVGGWLWLWG